MGDEWGVTSYEASRWGRYLLTNEYRHAKIDVIIFRGLKSICESKMGTPSSARIIEDVDLALKPLEIIYHANGAAVGGMADRNGHIRKVAGEGKSEFWGGARTKGKGREFKLTKNMFLPNVYRACAVVHTIGTCKRA